VGVVCCGWGVFVGFRLFFGWLPMWIGVVLVCWMRSVRLGWCWLLRTCVRLLMGEGGLGEDGEVSDD